MTQESGTAGSLAGARVLLIGASSGIARSIAEDLDSRDADVVLGGRDLARTEAVAAGVGRGVGAIRLDLGDEDTIAAAAEQLGEVDHVVSLAANHANGPIADLGRAAIAGAFDAKVIGPLLVAKHFASRMREGGTFVLFSGVAAWRPSPGLAVMATTNGAVAFLAEALAVELAPLRVVAVSPGIVDSGAWDGAGKDGFFADTASKNPARRVGRPEDVAAAVRFALTNPFVTGTVLHVDGGGRLA